MSELENHDYEVAKLKIEVERLEAEAAAMREALEEIMEEIETDRDRDIIHTACKSALAAGAGRELLERLRRAEHEREQDVTLGKSRWREAPWAKSWLRKS